MLYEKMVREYDIDGFTKWDWPKNDTGAWDGPVEDWVQSHRKVICSLPNRRAIIQAGGNCGLYPVLLSKLFHHVYTFEPFLANYEILLMNLLRHEAIDVTPTECALGPAKGAVSLHMPVLSNVGIVMVNGTTLSDAPVQGMDVEMHSIDELRETNHIPQWETIDMIWLDVEGFELAALLGAEKTITHFQPYIMAERPDDELIKYLQGLGYKQQGMSKMDGIFVHKTRRMLDIA